MSGPIDPVTGIRKVTKKDLLEHTEQALVQVVYVKTANDMIGGAMSNLDAALRTTQSVLNILQALQNLHNQIQVKSKSAFPFLFSTGGIAGTPAQLKYVECIHAGSLYYSTTIPITGLPMPGASGISLDPTSYAAAYQKAASAFFGKAIDPLFVFQSAGTSGFSDFADTISRLRNALRLEISALFAQTPADQRDNPGSLLANIRQVFKELPTNFNFSSLEKWAIDNFKRGPSTNLALAGAFQNNLTNAIVSAENLNDTQKERVRRFLFIFQEYYQSAAAVLSAIHQVISQIAQKVSQ